MAADEQGLRRRRGKGFPALPLDECIDLIKKIGTYGRQHTVSGFAGYLGHQTTNSGAFLSKMAALNDWGFIARRGEEVTLTDLAQRLAHPLSAEQAAESVREAFFNAELFSTVYRDSAKGTELSLELIGNRAVSALGVAAQRKAQFAQSFARSAIAAGIAKPGSGNAIELLSPQSTSETSPELREPDVPDPVQELRSDLSPGPDSNASAASRSPAATLHEEWPVSGGIVIFEARLDRPLPANAWADVAAVASAIEKLVVGLGSQQSSMVKS